MALFPKIFCLLLIVAASYCSVENSSGMATQADSPESSVIPNGDAERKIISRKFSSKMSKKKPPSVPSAPLDTHETVAHTLEELNQILGSVGGSGSGLVMGLTGVSITDCAGSVKGKDLTTLSCKEFLKSLSECDSLANVKPLLQQAAQNYKKNPKSKKPCFKK